MILLPKYWNSEVQVPTIIPAARTRLRGQFKFVMTDLCDRVVMETDWKDNLILDSGLDLIGQVDCINYCSIGDDATPAIISQTGLLNRLQTSSGGGWSSSSSWGVAPDYELTSTEGNTFPAGVALTVREIGRHAYNAPNDLYCRHVVAPTFVKSIDNILYTYYKHILYPALNDEVLNGLVIGGVTYDTIVRAMDVDRTFGYNGSHSQMMYNTLGTGSSFTRVWAGPIGTILTAPTGANTTSYALTQVQSPYVPGNHFFDRNLLFSISRGNTGDPDGFRSCQYPFTGCPAQIQFTATDGPNIGGGIPKDGTNQLDFTLRSSWARYVP